MVKTGKTRRRGVHPQSNTPPGMTAMMKYLNVGSRADPLEEEERWTSSRYEQRRSTVEVRIMSE